MPKRNCWREHVLSNYPIKCLLDGHGTIYLGEDAELKLSEKLSFLKALRDRVHHVVSQGSPRSLNQVVKAIFSSKDHVNAISMNEGWMSVLTARDFSRSNLIQGFVDEATAYQLDANSKTKEDESIETKSE